MADDLLDEALAGGYTKADAFKFANPGDKISGTLIDPPRAIRRMNDLSGQEETVMIITLQPDGTSSLTDARTLWLSKPAARSAVATAVRKDGGVFKGHHGGHLSIARGDDLPPKKKGYNPTQTYTATYKGPEVSDTDVDLFDDL